MLSRQPSALVGWLVACLVAFGLNVPDLQAADGLTKRMPRDVERLVKWLPEDTETLVVARSLVLTKPESMLMTRWSDVGIITAMESLRVAESKYLAPLLGRQVELAVRGARHFDVVTSFGGLRSENCTIFSFATDLDASGKALTDGLRKHANLVKTIAGREVFIFPSTISEEPWIRQSSWEGAYFVLLDPKTLLYATSDHYLTEVLQRIVHAPKVRALPDTLPEWKQVEFNSKAWMLRHYPREDPTTRAVGMTAACDDRQLRVVYTPRAGAEADRDQVRYQWTFGRVMTPEQRAKFRVEQQDDGSVVFIATQTPDFEADMGIWLFQVLKLQAMDVAWKKP